MAADASRGAAGRRGARSVCVSGSSRALVGAALGVGAGTEAVRMNHSRFPNLSLCLQKQSLQAGAGRHTHSVGCALAPIGVSKPGPSLAAHTQQHHLSVGASRKAVGKGRRSAPGRGLLVAR